MSKGVKVALLNTLGFISASAIPIGTIYYNFRDEFTADMPFYEKIGLGAGAFGLCAIIFVLTFWKFISPRLKTNPDLWAITLLLAWLTLAGVVFLIYSVISKIMAVAVAGMIGAFIACLFNIASYCVKHYGKEDKG